MIFSWNQEAKAFPFLSTVIRIQGCAGWPVCVLGAKLITFGSSMLNFNLFIET
jgi:hypothetical protein